MNRWRKRTILTLVIVLGLGALIVAGLSLRRPLLEQWYIWMLDSEDESKKKLAAMKLGELRSRRAIPPLVRELKKKPFKFVEADSAGMGYRLSGPRGKSSGPYTRVLNFSAEALIQIGRPATPALVELLKDENVVFRQAAVEMLSKIGPQAQAAVPALIKAIRDEDREVRRVAASALGEIGPGAAAALPILGKVIHENEEDLQWAAAAALANIGPEVEGTVAILVEAMKHESEKIRWIGVYGIRKMGPGAIATLPTLIKALEDEDTNVRYFSAMTLGQIGPRAYEAIPALRKALYDENENVRVVVEEALIKIGDGVGSRQTLSVEPWDQEDDE